MKKGRLFITAIIASMALIGCGSEENVPANATVGEEATTENALSESIMTESTMESLLYIVWATIGSMNIQKTLC